MRKIIFCLLSLPLSASSWLEAQVIKINVQKGQKYLLETSTNMSDSNEIAGETMKMNSEFKNTAMYEVKDMGKNEITFHVTVTRITTKTSFMEEETTFDSDVDKESPEAKLLSQKIGKPKKIVINNNGTIIKQDVPEKTDNPKGDWNFTGAQSACELFIPLFIGKEFKPGTSFPYLDSITIDKTTTSFSLNKETIDTRDSGTYIVRSIDGNVAGISYTGTKIFSMLMNTNGKARNSISKSNVKAELLVNINTGIVMNNTTTADVILYTGRGDKQFTSTSKISSTSKVTLIQ